MIPFLAAIALLFSCADHWTTYICLRAPVAGWQVLEANPLAAWLFEHLGLAQGLWLDTAITAGAMVFLVRTERVPEPMKLAFLGILVTTTGLAVSNNLDAVFQMGLSPAAL